MPFLETYELKDNYDDLSKGIINEDILHLISEYCQCDLCTKRSYLQIVMGYFYPPCTHCFGCFKGGFGSARNDIFKRTVEYIRENKKWV